MAMSKAKAVFTHFGVLYQINSCSKSNICSMRSVLYQGTFFCTSSRLATCNSSQIRNLSYKVPPAKIIHDHDDAGKRYFDGHRFISLVEQRRKYATHLIQECWRCGIELCPIEHQYFCHCGVVQPPKYCRNFFDVMGVDVAFDLDVVTMKTKYTELQRKLHPDKYTQLSETEKEFSLQQSSTVNKAYNTLTKPLSRGFYLLEIKGHSLEEDEILMDPMILMEVMEANEKLMEAESLDAVDDIGRENDLVISELLSKISNAFKDDDMTQARELLAKLKYYCNIEEKVKELRQMFV